MFDIGWTELLVIGVVALIVIGPKDLPEMFRQLGRFTAKIRSMARDFQRAMDQAAKDSGAGDVVKDLKTMTSANNLGLNAVKDAADKFEKWDPLKPAAKGAAPTKTPPSAPAAAKAPEAAAAKTPEVGPATRALREKQAARKAILNETAEKLKALKDPAPAAAASAPAKRAGARKAAASATGSGAAAAPKAPKTRKTGKTDTE